MPTATARRPCCASNEPIISPAWSPDGTRLAYVSFERKKPVVYVQSLATGQRQVGGEFQGQQQRAGMVARRQAARGGADQGRRLADLPDQRRRQRRADAADQQQRHRHRAEFFARRAVDHCSPPTAAAARRSTACPVSGGAAATADLRGQLQRVAAATPRRQELRLRPAQRRPLQRRGAGFRDAARCRC